jgi:hypothetical protein
VACGGLTPRADRIICLIPDRTAKSTRGINEAFPLTASYWEQRRLPVWLTKGFTTGRERRLFLFLPGFNSVFPGVRLCAGLQHRDTGDTGIRQILRHRLRRRFPGDRHACAGRVARRRADRLSRRSPGSPPDSHRRAAACRVVILSHRGGAVIWRVAGLSFDRRRGDGNVASGPAGDHRRCRKARAARPADERHGRYRGAGRLIGPPLGGLLAAWSIRVPFVAHGILALLAIVPSLFLIRESAPSGTMSGVKNTEDQLDTKAVVALMLDAKYRGFLCAQFFASMTRGVLWGGTLLLYATFAYDVGARGLGGLATMSTVVGIPITLSCGYLMDRFGRKTTMVPGFVLMALGLFFLAANAHWHWGLAIFTGAFLWMHASHAVTSGSMQVLGSDMAPAHARGRFFGFWRLIGEIGGLVSPALFGFVAEHMGYTVSFAMIGLCSLATAMLLAFSVQETVSSRREA